MLRISPPADGSGLRVGVVVGRFHTLVADRLAEGALEELRRLGVRDEDTVLVDVPGAFEVPLAALALARSGRVDAVVCLGCVVEGETDHYRHVCEQAAAGIQRAALETGVPCALGVLTVRTMDHALERSGGAAGNKGRDAARAAVETARALRAIAEA